MWTAPYKGLVFGDDDKTRDDLAVHTNQPTNEPASASGRQELEAEAWMTDGVNELCPKLPSQPKIGHSEFKWAAFLYMLSPFIFTQSTIGRL